MLTVMIAALIILASLIFALVIALVGMWLVLSLFPDTFYFEIEIPFLKNRSLPVVIGWLTATALLLIAVAVMLKRYRSVSLQ